MRDYRVGRVLICYISEYSYITGMNQVKASGDSTELASMHYEPKTSIE